MSMNFGPINLDGGERRLNVLFTRARLRCEVFASFDPGDIDLGRTAKNGPRVLKRYLEFAKTGQLDEKLPLGMDADSPFEEDVARTIRAFGFDVDHQVGSAGFRIDLGVRHPSRPGRYVLAVECDGATYHSALWARERDRLRQAVLEGLDWRFHRIWSTDWFYRRESEIARLKLALEQANGLDSTGRFYKGANRDWRPAAESTSPELPHTEIVLPELAASGRTCPRYERFVAVVTARVEPHEADQTILSDLAFRIVQKEGPIHQDEVARRIASTFGKERTGSRINDATLRALHGVRSDHAGDILNDGEFWFTAAQAKDPPVRDRSQENGSITKAEYLAPIEITMALKMARDDSAGASDEDLTRAAARMLGFKRVGPDLSTLFLRLLRSGDKSPAPDS